MMLNELWSPNIVRWCSDAKGVFGVQQHAGPARSASCWSALASCLGSLLCSLFLLSYAKYSFSAKNKIKLNHSCDERIFICISNPCINTVFLSWGRLYAPKVLGLGSFYCNQWWQCMCCLKAWQHQVSPWRYIHSSQGLLNFTFLSREIYVQFYFFSFRHQKNKLWSPNMWRSIITNELSTCFLQ